ncbi:MAG: crossover junction endodeoxyribonuclease RuvC [Epsilonproteobacteria bacterium]|nr:crossover junction endodeoxyribonuclease RuvC [Campylobacterota bacterium]
MEKVKTSCITLGVDPGFSVTGFGVMQRKPNGVQLLDCGYLKMRSSDSLVRRTGIFYHFFKDKIEQLHISHIALETPFLGKNAQTFLKLGYLRGILYLLADQHQIPTSEFAPKQVKTTVTGFGGASKDQVALMVHRLFPNLHQKFLISKNDITDALAVCLCGVWTEQAYSNIAKNYM